MQGNREFDNIIKQKMDGFTPSVTATSWASLSQKMDAIDTEEMENDVFDAMSREKLHKYEARYNADHWQIMAAKLEREFYFVQELLRWKTMEVALMVLFLITFGRFFPGGAEKTPHQINTSNLMMIALEETNTADDININNRQEKSIEEVALGAISSSGSLNSSSSSNEVQVTSSVVDKRINTGKENNARIIPSAIVPKLEEHISLLKNIIPDLKLDFISLHSTVNLLPPFEVSPLEYVADLVLALPIPQKRKFALRIGMFGSPNIDRIVNPILFIDGKEIPSYTRYSMGYSGGVSLGFDRGDRWEYETGITYTSKQYTPAPVHFHGGNIAEGFSKEVFIFFEMNALSIPLHVRYNYLIRDKWRLYAYGGASWQVNIQSYYHLASLDPNKGRSPDKPSTRNKTLKDIEEELVKGLFDKGSLRKNSYLTLDTGIGAERYIRNHWSIFSQVNYMHNFLQYKGGFGPYTDKINTLSVSMGVKMRIDR